MRKLRERLRRQLCLALGCGLAEYGPCCPRCGAELYYSDFVQVGYLNPFQRALDRIRALPGRVSRPCDTCRKRMWFTRDACCSEKCYSEWVPF
jgi:hypothetical protein